MMIRSTADVEPEHPRCLVLRLAGPLQSWGAASRFNRRETEGQPTKSGLLGLLAAAQGRRRSDSLEDLLALRLGVRTDVPGTLMRDYHTVSDYRGVPLPSATVDSKGEQKPSRGKYTHVTRRYYLQDAVFVAAVSGREPLLSGLVEALARPAFPLSLGRRACPPTQPLLLSPSPESGGGDGAQLWEGRPDEVLALVPWQASDAHVEHKRREDPHQRVPAQVDLPVTVDDARGDDIRSDVPASFDPRGRAFLTRRIRHDWVRLPTGLPNASETEHDPFALLGW